MQKILTRLKEKKVIDLPLINDVLGHFKYQGSDKVNRPSKLLSTTNVKQTASQMWNFLRFFPLQFSPFIPADEPLWELVILLVSIVDVVMSPCQCPESIALMHTHIQDFNDIVRETFGSDSLTPKMHFLTHYPSLTSKFGPLYHCSTLRFEAKHSYFKSIARQTKNTKNICYTLAKRHQLLQCYQSCSTNLLANEMVAGQVRETKVDELPEDIQLLIAPLHVPGSHYQKASKVTINGTKYCKDMCLCVAVKGGLCQFAQIDMIFIKECEAYFVCNDYTTISYDKKRHAYLLSVNPDVKSLRKQSSFLSYYPLHIYTNDGHKFVVLKYTIIEELLQ